MQRTCIVILMNLFVMFSAEPHIRESPGHTHTTQFQCVVKQHSMTEWQMLQLPINFKGAHVSTLQMLHWISSRKLTSDLLLSSVEVIPNRKPVFLLWAPELGRISLIDILDTVAPLSTHILSLTPSAPWLDSPLSHEQRQDGSKGTTPPLPPAFKKISEHNFGLVREEWTLLWFTRLHFSDQKWSLKWIQVKRAHRLHGGAGLKLRIMLTVNQIFYQHISCYYTKLHKNLLNQPWCITTQWRLCCIFYPHHTETSIKTLKEKKMSRCQKAGLVFPEFDLFRV